jgi:Big-like domain-containing protein
MFPRLAYALSPLRVAVLLALVAAGGCTLDTNVSVGPAGLIKIPDGDGQTAATSTTLPTPLSVIVVNQFGERLPDVTVNWAIASGGGMLSATSTQTDALGVASVNYTTGATAESVVIQARVQGVPPLTFNITVT